MIHIYKVNGERFVYDVGSDTSTPITALQQKMLSYIKPPMTEDLPTSLRYDLAKYDGGMVSDAYDELYGLYLDGKLFSPVQEGKCENCIAAARCALSERSAAECEKELARVITEITSR